MFSISNRPANSSNAVCQFYQTGSCKFGAQCWNKHQIPRVFGSTNNQSSVSNVFASSSSPANNQIPQNDPKFNEFTKQIATEMNTWELNSMWQLSVLAPLQDHPQLAGFTDTSPEELRLEAYEALHKNNGAAYESSVKQKLNFHTQLRQALKNRSSEAVEAMKAVFYKNANQNQTAQQPSSNVFGGTSSVFGGGSTNQNAASIFGGNSNQNAGSVFGSTNKNTKSVFGSSAANQSSAFVAKPVFGAKASVFGSSSAFGANSKLFGGGSNSAFQSTTNVFGAKSSNIFGQTSTSASGTSSSSNTGFGALASSNQGSNLFGSSNSGTLKQSSGIFGASQGSSAFGAPTAQNAFGAPTAQNAFRSTTQQQSVFGAQPNAFGAVNQSPTPVFGGNTGQSQTSVFGGKTGQSQASVFGGNNTGQSQTSVFGGNNNSQSQNTLFGGNQSQNNIFGGSSSGQSQNIFSAPAPSSNTNIFGANQANTITQQNVTNPGILNPQTGANAFSNQNNALNPQNQPTTETPTPTDNTTGPSTISTPGQDPPKISQHVAYEIYTPLNMLSIEDRQEFEKDVFTKIPLVPPPRELCF